MIKIQTNKQIIKSAQLLESRTRNTYPHISTSRFKSRLSIDSPVPKFLENLGTQISMRRNIMRNSVGHYSSIIFGLSEKKVGNCTEDAIFTQLIGLINGQKNIYAGGITLNAGGKGHKNMNHSVAFITDKSVQRGKVYAFKNKEAVVIDPWLGVADFAGNYFAKLKSIFRKNFMRVNNENYAVFNDDSLQMESIRKEAKTAKEFNSIRKNEYLSDQIGIVSFASGNINSYEIEQLKEMFPELSIKNYKEIILPQEKKAK